MMIVCTSSTLRHENICKSEKANNLNTSQVCNASTKQTGTLDSLSRLHVTISLYAAEQAALSKLISADLENLTLSDGVRNMSERLPAFSMSSEVVYSKEYEIVVLVECSSPRFQEFEMLKYAPYMPSTAATFKHASKPKPAHVLPSILTAGPPSMWNAIPFELCKEIAVKRLY